MKNVRPLDRFLRAAIGLVLLEAGYFWLGSPWNWAVIALGAALLLSAILGFCPLYRMIGVNLAPAKQASSKTLRLALAGLVLAAIALGGSYASIFFSRKFFLEDFNAMNAYYKQALFLTGKGEREAALSNFDKLIPGFESFSERYAGYRPYNLKGDIALEGDFMAVRNILKEADPLVRTGDLHEAHLTLERVRPVFQNMFKRNGFSMLSVALVDFHDAIEKILAAATAKDASGVISIYPEVSDKLKAIESETNDTEIMDIRKGLEDLLASAKAGEAEALPGEGDTLKSRFVKVYLKRG